MREIATPAIRTALCVAIGASALAGCAGVAAPAPRDGAPTLWTGGEVTPPFGAMDYCRRQSDDCADRDGMPSSVVQLTPARWAELDRVNRYVNGLPQVEDRARYGLKEYWTVADESGGDCEDMALRKRRELVALGWPRAALLMTTARQLDGSLHALLTVVTDRGDYVLDNQNWAILPAAEAPYRLVARQASGHPSQWLALDAAAPASAPASTGPSEATDGARP